MNTVVKVTWSGRDRELRLRRMFFRDPIIYYSEVKAVIKIYLKFFLCNVV